MNDIQELYHLFPEIKNQIEVEKKVGQGKRSQRLVNLHLFFLNNSANI